MDIEEYLGHYTEMRGNQPELLFLPDGNLSCAGIEDILWFGAADGVIRILADIPGKEELPELYERAGFRRACFYRCYQKELKQSYQAIPLSPSVFPDSEMVF